MCAMTYSSPPSVSACMVEIGSARDCGRKGGGVPILAVCVCAFLCVNACCALCAYVCTRACACACECVCVYVHVHVHVSVSVCVCI